MISPPIPKHCSLLRDKQRRRTARRNLRNPAEMEICNYLGGGGGAVEGDGKSWDTGHGREPQEQPFSIGKHPLPQEHLVREVGEGAPNPSTVAAPGWVLRRGCCGEESQEPWGGLLGHPRPLPHPSGQRWPW